MKARPGELPVRLAVAREIAPSDSLITKGIGGWVRRQLAEDAAAEFDAPPRGLVPDKYARTPVTRRQGTALVHVYEELAQHHGQLELTRDVLLAAVRS